MNGTPLCPHQTAVGSKPHERVVEPDCPRYSSRRPDGDVAQISPT